jgi:glycosyltransferase involved in cell wall biosynthesis
MEKLSILGIRGIPAKHGGFETFAEKLALYMVNSGWAVSVYCQDEKVKKIEIEIWKGVELIKIPSKNDGALDTIIFDYKAIQIAKKTSGIFLTLGYNTAIFCALLKINNKLNIINMDGLEWKRRKYNQLEKLWLYINERLGLIFPSHVIADNPVIEKRIKKIAPLVRPITMIPYGADRPNNILSQDKQINTLCSLGINSSEYVLIIARPVEENNIYEVVQAFSNKRRNHKLVILGEYGSSVEYQRKVLNIAGSEVLFLGAIYDKRRLDILRSNARLYIHGHSVGGTNPALVEAMSAGLPVLAHNNPFNRWVAGDDAHYFLNEAELDQELDALLYNNEEIKKMSIYSLNRFNKNFRWNKILDKYEKVFYSYIN